MPQSLGKIYVHVVFSTKNRVPLIDMEIEDSLFKVLSNAILKSGSCPVIVGGYIDHVHLCFNLHRTKTISKTIEIAKNISSKWIKTRGEKYLNFYWQNGYGAFSIASTDLQSVKLYIKNQRKKHQKMNYREEAILLMQKNQIEYNDAYFWD